MKRARTTDIALSALIAVLICFSLAPAVARMQRSSAEAKCQSNLRRWAQAMSAYLADNHQRYPTNRQLEGYLTNRVVLSDPTAVGPDGKPLRFQNGVNWVEALYPYIQAAATRTGQDWKSFRRCPNARDMAVGANASMTYSMNYNIIEEPKAIVRDPWRLMMFREMDKLVGSVLRPSNHCSWATDTPVSAFLAPRDFSLGLATTQPCDRNRHGSGSYICFADGHIKYFTNDYFPTWGSGSTAVSACYWDVYDQRWYNIVDSSVRSKTIAVSP
jgi:prepilin-type processing-associated H-X9-DG protein